MYILRIFGLVAVLAFIDVLGYHPLTIQYWLVLLLFLCGEYYFYRSKLED